MTTRKYKYTQKNSELRNKILESSKIKKNTAEQMLIDLTEMNPYETSSKPEANNKSGLSHLQYLNAPQDSLAVLIQKPYLLKSLLDVANNENIMTIIAILNRTVRFRKKYGYLSSINNLNPRKNPEITKRFTTMWEKLCKTKVYLNNAPKDFNITIPMTINHIKLELTILERELKTFIVPLCMTYDIHYPQANILRSPTIYAALNSIAPSGFYGWEPDSCFVIRTLLEPRIAMETFTPIQRRQWHLFHDEILDLFHFFFYEDIKRIDFSSFSEKQSYTMNVPFKRFMNPVSKDGQPCKCPNETFSRFITVSIKFIIQLYHLSYIHLRETFPNNLNDT